MPGIDPELLPEKALKQMGLSREEFREVARRMEERERKSPPVGGLAPDFELAALSATGEPTGETVRLAEHLERPVALVFGSYT